MRIRGRGGFVNVMLTPDANITFIRKSAMRLLLSRYGAHGRLGLFFQEVEDRRAWHRARLPTAAEIA